MKYSNIGLLYKDSKNVTWRHGGIPCHIERHVVYDIGIIKFRRRVSSVVEHSSANPKVPSSNLSHSRVMDYDEACFMHLTPGVVHNFPNAVGV